MFTTGTVISHGCNLFQEDKKPPRYYKPFSWGVKGKYEIDRFIEDTRKMMSGRNIKLSESREKFLRDLYKKSV
jgi:hypothetical protein